MLQSVFAKALRVAKLLCRGVPRMLLAIVVLSEPALSEPRIALVVGNQAYKSVVALENPVADAALIAARLGEKGFKVTHIPDAGQTELNLAIAQFGRDLRAAGDDATGLFYYAGHGVQSFGANYLLPVDIELTDAADLSLVAVRADAVLRQMASAQNRTNIFILDACRNNPFENIPDMNDNGLAEMKAPTGTFMAYSTAPGSVALDGTSANSPFTEALSAAIDRPGATIEQVFKEVRTTVLQVTNGHQTPWDTSSLTGDFFFTPTVQKSAEEIAAQQFFESIRKTRDPVQIVLFLRTYPKSEYFEEARAMLSEVLDGGGPPDTAALAPKGTVASTESSLGTAQAKTSNEDSADLEKEMIDAAQKSGSVTDYEAYLTAFPNGVFAELAQMEIAAKVAKDPESPPEGLSASAPTEVPPVPRTASTATSGTSDALVLFSTPLSRGGPDVEGRSIEQLIAGTPKYPPIEGLPAEVWKGRPCSTCHEWTRSALCDQAKTYLADSGTRSLAKEHPYGGGLKSNLRDWASGDCR